jgi:hypothetical protein
MFYSASESHGLAMLSPGIPRASPIKEIPEPVAITNLKQLSASHSAPMQLAVNVSSVGGALWGHT